jgi:alpha-1,3-glucosyltransferase
MLMWPVIVACFWPFVAHDPTRELQAIIVRLFPFGRGLCHEYWAPNVWALYAATDRALRPMCLALSRWAVNPMAAALAVSCQQAQSVTGGPVATFSVLPPVWPALCAMLGAGLLVVGALWPLWRQVHHSRAVLPELLTGACTTCALVGFLFGWHVHEKALLVPVVLAG